MNAGKVTLRREIKADYFYDEAIKTLRTNIQFCGNDVKTILFTSAMPDEGKSDVAFALADSLARIGKKTLLIDADIRKSILVSRYHLEGEINGLSQYLSGQKELSEIVYDTSTDNLSVIFAGPYSPSCTELLEEEIFGIMVSAMREEYDYVIIDTPPMANLIDAAVVARYCDGAVVVIEAEAISYRLEQRVKDQLEKTGVRILGAVLNKVSAHEEGRYGRYGKYGKYAKYGKYGKYEKYGKYRKYTKYGIYDSPDGGSKDES